jgi:FAD/FMN-containing dehydrogenase
MGSLLEAAKRFMESWSAPSDRFSAPLPRADFCAAHATEGIVRVGVDLPPRERAEAGAAALESLANAVVSAGGTWTYDAGAARLREILGEAATLPAPTTGSAEVVALERALKARFDPAGILPEYGS